MNFDLKKYKNIFMSGIGGSSMSGIAVMLKKWGFNVSGSDANYSSQVEWLNNMGIEVKIGQIQDNITDDIDLFIYTAAIKDNNPEMIRAKELNIPRIERGTFLGDITRLYKDTIGIAGTHGKTSTTSMVATAFLEADLDPSIQIGANLKLLNGNYRVGNSDYLIVEACEYSESYLNFTQRSAIVLNIDNDHLDYFKTIENIEKSFQKYVSMLPTDGFLVLNRDDSRCYNLKNYTKANVITVGTTSDADWFYNNVIFDNDGFPTYDVYHNNNFVGKISLKVTGVHNIFNSLCCVALCDAYGISLDVVANALLKFDGAARRLEYKGTLCGAKVYDDYGHHPTEIMATLKGIKNKKINKSWVVFEPHTFSRLAQHLTEFAEALLNFDNIIITDIYAAREVNTYNISVEDLMSELKKLGKDSIHISDYDEIIEYLKNNVSEGDLILTLGAGTVTNISNKIKETN